MTKKELATVLAALRYWQQDLEANDDPPISGEHFAECEPLTSAEIDALCERLNAQSAEPATRAMPKGRLSARTPKVRMRRGKARR